MNTQDYTAAIMVDQAPQEAFTHINSVSKWWSEDMEGSTAKLNDVFTVRFGDVYITSKVVELVPNEKIVWQVLDCNKPWLKNTKEWNGTKMSWEIARKDDKTLIRLTHIGLVSEVECYDVCSNAWNEYLQGSLLKLISTGNGKPTLMKKAA